MSERPVVITQNPNRRKEVLQAVSNWSASRMGVAEEVLGILDELTLNRIPWREITTANEKAAGYRREGTVVSKVTQDAAVKIGMTAAGAEWDLWDPRVVYFCGVFGKSEVEKYKANALIAAEAAPGRIFETPERGKEVEREARRLLLLADNDDLEKGPPGYAQVMTSSLGIWVDSNVQLQTPEVTKFLEGLLDLREMSTSPTRKQLRERMFSCLRKDDFTQASQVLEELKAIPVTAFRAFRR